MPSEDNGPNVSLPSAGDLKDFLDGAEPVVEPVVQEQEDTLPLKDVRVDEEPDEMPAGDSFDRKYVEKLRRESASYRERAKKYEQVFEGYEDGAVDEWKTMISSFRQDPKGVAEQMRDLSAQILDQFTPAEQAEIVEAVQDEEKPLTMSQLQSILDQRQQETELSSLVADIEGEARELGYNLKSREYKILLMTAQELPSGSIQEAHELLESEKQREFDKRIGDLEKAGGGYRRPSDLVGVPSNEKSIKDFKQAKEALGAFLDANLK